MVEKVFEFPRGRAKSLSEAEALGRLFDQIRRDGRVEVESITALGKIWNWTQSRTSKAVTRWKRAGHIVREQGAGGKLVIGFPGHERHEQESEGHERHEQGKEHVIDPPQEHGIHAAVPGVPAHVPGPLLVVPGPAIIPAGVPAPMVKQSLELHDLLVWCRRVLGVVLIGLSIVLYIVGLNLNATFWPSLDPTGESKGILRAGGAVIESVNYVVPSAIALAPQGSFLWGFWSVTMVMGATAEASYVRSSLGAGEVSRQTTINERTRLLGIVDSIVKPVSNDTVKYAQAAVDTAKATAKTDCPKNRSLDLEVCNKSRAALKQAEIDLKKASEMHDDDVRRADQQHRDDVADAQAKLKDLPVISADKNAVLAGIMALVPVEVPEAWANRIVAVLWVVLFSFGPCLLLRSGLVLLIEDLPSLETTEQMPPVN
jgi:hypothetical protein